MTKHRSLSFALGAVALCSALSACMIRTSGPYDHCESDPQYCEDIWCQFDRDCPTGRICDRTSNTCAATSTCYPGQTCPHTYRCDARATCVPDGWTGDTGTGGRGGGGRGGASTGGINGSTGGRVGSGGAGTGGATGNPATGGTTGMPATGGMPGTGGAAGAGGAGPSCMVI
jgi:hypothetical protein